MFSLSTIIAMNAAVDRKRKKDRERAAAKRAAAKQAAKKTTLTHEQWSDQDAALNRYLQDNDQ